MRTGVIDLLINRAYHYYLLRLYSEINQITCNEGDWLEVQFSAGSWSSHICPVHYGMHVRSPV